MSHLHTETLVKWQIFAKSKLSQCNSNEEERFTLAILELVTPYISLGYKNLEEFLFQVPKIGDVLIDESNVIREPEICQIDSSSILNQGDKVVWFRDDGKEMTGVVQWLGMIEDILCAGIICNQRVGPDTEIRFKGEPLFHAPLGHGKIIPVRELIHLSDLNKGKEGSSSVMKTLTKPINALMGWQKSQLQGDKGTLNVNSQSVKFNKEREGSPTSNNNDVYPRAMEASPTGGLRVLDVVVWVTDTGSFNGIVMWLGQLRSGGGIWAGVDFQQNIGECNGTYGEHVLFQCLPKQGKFIPIEYLVKYDDFIESSVKTKLDEEKQPSETNKLAADSDAEVNLIELKDLEIGSTEKSHPSAPLETAIQAFQIEDRVKCYPNKKQTPLKGTIKWIGRIGNKQFAGIDFDEPTRKEDVFPFESKPGHAGLAPLTSLEHFGPNEDSNPSEPKVLDFSTARSPEEFYRPKHPDSDDPILMNTFIEPIMGVKNYGRSIGFHHGIQGANNSCYIDATLFLMLAYTDAFDEILLKDDPLAPNPVRQLKGIIRAGIANQLRRNYFCSCDQIGTLRKAMSGLSSRIRNCEMADVEEFIFTLFEHGLQTERFIHYSSGVSEFFHQVLTNSKDLNENVMITTTQKMLERSMVTQHNLKFITPPSPGLFLALPRSKKELVQYKAIVPSLTIDITHLLHTASRPCTICSTQAAVVECLDCFDIIGNAGMSATGFCESCFHTFHIAESRKGHKEHAKDILNSGSTATFKSVKLDLIGVICIKDSHYVSFVKCGTDLLAPWVTHNSMAEGGIPEIRDVPGLGECLLNLEKDYSCVSKEWELYLPEVQQILKNLYFCVYTLHKEND